jgi:dolichol-phosphate mannosyltransferase
MRCLVIIPTYNERDNLRSIVSAVLALGEYFEVLIVDDNSPDGTGVRADELVQENARVSVLHRSGKLGLGTAYLAGFKHALVHEYEYVCEMDADFSHDPADLPRLLEAAQSADVVIGSRRVAGGGAPNWSLMRNLISRFGSLYARVLLQLPVADLTSGFKVFRRRVLADLDLQSIGSNGYAFQVELNCICHRRGYRIVEVPIVFVDRRVGKSKMHLGIVLEAMWMVIRYRLARPAAPILRIASEGSSD